MYFHADQSLGIQGVYLFDQLFPATFGAFDQSWSEVVPQAQLRIKGEKNFCKWSYPAIGLSLLIQSGALQKPEMTDIVAGMIAPTGDCRNAGSGRDRSLGHDKIECFFTAGGVFPPHPEVPGHFFLQYDAGMGVGANSQPDGGGGMGVRGFAYPPTEALPDSPLHDGKIAGASY